MPIGKRQPPIARSARASPHPQSARAAHSSLKREHLVAHWSPLSAIVRNMNAILKSQPPSRKQTVNKLKHNSMSVFSGIPAHGLRYVDTVSIERGAGTAFCPKKSYIQWPFSLLNRYIFRPFPSSTSIAGPAIERNYAIAAPVRPAENCNCQRPDADDCRLAARDNMLTLVERVMRGA